MQRWPTSRIRQQAYDAAVADLPAYVRRRWAELPKTVTPALALAWVRFFAMDPAEEAAVFGELYRRSTVLTIDRANQIAQVLEFVITSTEAETVAA